MEVIEVQCYKAGCGHSPYPMSKAFNERARRTHEVFHCPAGHAQSFQGQTREERDIAQLEKDIAVLRHSLAWTEDALQRVARTCPWIECGFRAASGNTGDRRPLQTHMRAVHGMPTLAEVREAS